MTDLNTTIINNIENIIESNSNGCTIYKQEFTEPTAIGINIGIFDGQYIFVKDNTPKISIFYNVSYNAIRLCFFKFSSNIDGVFSKVYDIPLFDTNKLEEVLTLVFSKIEF